MSDEFEGRPQRSVRCRRCRAIFLRRDFDKHVCTRTDGPPREIVELDEMKD